MYTRKLNYEEAPIKWWAARDAKQRSYAWSTHYSQVQRNVAECMRLALEVLYHHAGVFVNFRQKFISIKVQGKCRAQDRNMLNDLEADWTFTGVTKVKTPQGVIYRIPRKEKV